MLINNIHEMLLTRLYPATARPKQLNKNFKAVSSLNKTTSTFKFTLTFWYLIYWYSKGMEIHLNNEILSQIK